MAGFSHGREGTCYALRPLITKHRLTAYNKIHPAAPARVRDNQRRSRARRKEYIKELEKRIETFERLGVKINVEIQSAARKVVKENLMLKSLLSDHGVPNAEVENYLKIEGGRGTARLLPKAEITPPVMLTDMVRNEPPDQHPEGVKSPLSEESPGVPSVGPEPRDYTSDLKSKWPCSSTGSDRTYDCERRDPLTVDVTSCEEAGEAVINYLETADVITLTKDAEHRRDTEKCQKGAFSGRLSYRSARPSLYLGALGSRNGFPNERGPVQQLYLSHYPFF